MKTSLLNLLAAMLPLLTQAQGTIYSSNLANTPTGNFAVAGDSWIAQEFVWEAYTVNGVTLTPDCTLNSVQLLMDTASGNPSGFTVSIYTDNSSGPGRSLGTLTGDPDPESPGVYSYTTPGITLSPGNGYFVVVTSVSPSLQGAYNWSTTTSYASDDKGLQINNVTSYLTWADVYGDSTDGSSWNFHLRQAVGQMAIYGTPVPEPSICLMLVCGVGLLFLRWWLLEFRAKRWNRSLLVNMVEPTRCTRTATARYEFGPARLFGHWIRCQRLFPAAVGDRDP